MAARTIDEPESINEATQDFPHCNECKHHIDGLKCKAFDEIPLAILAGEDKHLVRINGQTGDFVFEKK